MDFTRFNNPAYSYPSDKSFLLLNEQNLLYFCLQLSSEGHNDSRKVQPHICCVPALQTKPAQAETGVSQLEQKQFSWLPAQQGGPWYKTGDSPGNPPMYVFVDCKELSKMDRLSSNSAMLSSLSPATPSTLRDKWSFLRRMSIECSFLSQRFIASLDTTVFSKATMINWIAGERKKNRQWAEKYPATLTSTRMTPMWPLWQIFCRASRELGSLLLLIVFWVHFHRWKTNESVGLIFETMFPQREFLVGLAEVIILHWNQTDWSCCTINKNWLMGFSEILPGLPLWNARL